jgi:hypothetical protein
LPPYFVTDLWTALALERLDINAAFPFVTVNAPKGGLFSLPRQISIIHPPTIKPNPLEKT